MRGLFTKSIVAACPIPVGTILKREHLDFKKPGDGIPPERYTLLLGRETIRPLAKDECISDEHLRQP
jgi:sialic acid synthase SpsE